MTTSPDLSALKTLVELAKKATPGPWRRGSVDEYGCAYIGTACDNHDAKGYNFEARVAECDFIVAAHAAIPALERLLASQGKPEAEAVPGSSVCPICGKDSPHYHKPEEATMYNAKFVGVGPQFVQDALQHVYAAMDAMRRKGARENYDRGYNAGFNVSADILEAALKDIKSKLGWIAERTGEFPPIVFDAEAAANRALPSDKLRGLAKAASTRIHDAGCWSEDFIYQVLSEALLSQEPSSGAPVTADVEPASPVQEAGREEPVAPKDVPTLAEMRELFASVDFAPAEPASLGAEAARLERLNALADSLDTPKASCDGKWVAEKIREAING